MTIVELIKALDWLHFDRFVEKVAGLKSLQICRNTDDIFD